MMNRVMRNILLSVPVIFALNFIAPDCSALRCGDEIISTGDSKARVLIKCGKPTYKEKSGAKKAGETKGDQKNGITIAARMILFTPLPLKRVF